MPVDLPRDAPVDYHSCQPCRQAVEDFRTARAIADAIQPIERQGAGAAAGLDPAFDSRGAISIVRPPEPAPGRFVPGFCYSSRP